MEDCEERRRQQAREWVQRYWSWTISNAPCHFVQSTTFHMLDVRHMTHMYIASIIITFRAYGWVICTQIIWWIWSLYTICCIQSFFVYTYPHKWWFCEHDGSYLLFPEYPSCLQATLASTLPQASSHTVPHLPFRQTSTRPSFGWVPPTSLILPSVQAIVC